LQQNNYLINILGNKVEVESLKHESITMTYCNFSTPSFQL
jgi:hypothetical protein